MTGGTAKRLDRAFKLAAVERMAAGENVSALSQELKKRRKLLYQWRDTVRRGGAEPLRGIGRPRSGEQAVVAVARPRLPVPPRVAAPDELGQAQVRIAELERKSAAGAGAGSFRKSLAAHGEGAWAAERAGRRAGAYAFIQAWPRRI